VGLQWLWQLALYGIYTIMGLEGAMLAGTLLLFLGTTRASRGTKFPWPKALGAGLLLSMGLQTLLSSFFFSFLRISFRMRKNKQTRDDYY